MIDAALRTFALVASVVIALSFALFAVEHTRDASQAQASAVIDDGGAIEAKRAREHTKAREVVDDSNDVLLRPFAALIKSDNDWAERGIPALFGLIVYGVGFLYLARLLKIRTRPIIHHHHAPAPTAPNSTGSAPPPRA